MEKWKDIPNYEGLYQVSDLGRVKSLDRCVNRGVFIKRLTGTIIKPNKDGQGYLGVDLNNEGIRRRIKIHQLVAMAFLGHVPNGKYDIVVDHKDNNRLNNNIDNIQLISCRLNVSKDKINKYSKYTGVSFIKKTGKWKSSIKINGKGVHLGNFYSDIEAGGVYTKAVMLIDKYNGNNEYFRSLLN